MNLALPARIVLLLALASLPSRLVHAQATNAAPVDAAPAPEYHFTSSEWHPLLDDQLSQWDRWLGAPHKSITTGLPPGTPLSDDGHKGVPLGLNNDPLHVFTVDMVDGEPVVHVTGEVLGAITTRDSFSNYHLRVQIKWGEKKWEPKLTVARDSGLLYDCTGPNGKMWNAWKRCLEFQIQENDMGDLFCLEGTCARLPITKGPKRWHYDPTAPVQAVGAAAGAVTGDVAHLPGKFEKPNGQWNVLDLYNFGTRSVQVVNGHIVLATRGLAFVTGKDKVQTPLTGGQIQLQSEGAEVYFRRVEIKPITDIPAKIKSELGWWDSK